MHVVRTKFRSSIRILSIPISGYCSELKKKMHRTDVQYGTAVLYLVGAYTVQSYGCTKFSTWDARIRVVVDAL